MCKPTSLAAQVKSHEELNGSCRKGFTLVRIEEQMRGVVCYMDTSWGLITQVRVSVRWKTHSDPSYICA